MATLSLNPLSHTKLKPLLVITPTRVITIVSCQNRNSDEAKGGKEKKGVMMNVLVGVEKLGKGVQDKLSPKQKGDWKDLTLMSLSFAVYIYMSQKIVCAYCLWMSMAGQASW